MLEANRPEDSHSSELQTAVSDLFVVETTGAFSKPFEGVFKVNPLKLFYYQTFFETWHS